MNATPTLYEWAGGKAAIRRLMDCFYDRVERDELLSPYFPGGVSEEHRAHVAAWWSEVPRRISASASSEHFVETPHQYLRRRGTGARGGARELSNKRPVQGGEMSPIAFPGESAEYRAARNRLLEREVELRRQMEAVAAARRDLPPGGAVPEDYVFEAAGARGAPSEVRMSELFAPGKDSLVIYNFMFPRTYGGDRPGPVSGKTAQLPLEEGPCPSCVALLDQLDGAALHAAQHLNFAVVAKTSLQRLLTWGDERGWRHLRLLSSAGNAYNRDYHGETADGSQVPMLNVFHRDGETIRHFWGAELTFAPMDPGQDHRSVGTLEPLWNMLDLTREERPDWDEKLSYG